MTAGAEGRDDVFAAVAGQDRAVAHLRAAARRPVHAYLLVGPAGSGKRAAAEALAAAVLCPQGGCGTCPTCRRALAGSHPDVVVVERAGPFISVGQAREIQRVALRTPHEAARKVLVLTDFHLVRDAAPTLLKVVEEPPPSTVFVILAEHVPPELVTIASRCVRVDFAPRAEEGEHPGRQVWASVPRRLDGTGAAVAVLVSELVEQLDGAVAALQKHQAAERAALEERVGALGEKGAGRREQEERHRREQRRLRTDELRLGLATLARAYRDALSRGTVEARASVAAIEAVQAAAEALAHNPNEALLLQALLLRLPALSGDVPYTRSRPG